MEKAAKNNAASRAGAGRTCVLVLGMHRSGTSAMSRVLNLLGCDLPKTLMEANATNEAGHWESLPIARLNDDILNSAGSTWHDWLEFNQGWYASPKAEEFKERALEMLESEYGNSRLFVLKDPRICRFVPFWLDVLDSAGVKPVIIRQVRNPLEVAESLSKRNGIDAGLGHLLWLSHVLEAEAGTRGRQRFQSSYERLLQDWPRLISEMQDALKVSWPRLSALTNDEIDQFLTEKLRHHVKSADAVIANPFLSAWLRDTFSIFSRWAHHGESSDDYSELDRIRAELNAAAPAFARLILSGHQRGNELKSARNTIEEQKKKLAGLEAEQQGLAEKQAGVEGELKAVCANLEEARKDLSESRASLTERDREIEAVRGEIVQRNSELEIARAENVQRNSELEAVRGELAQRESDLETVRGELIHRESDLETVRGDLVQRESELETIRGEVVQRNSELEDVQGELSRVQVTLAQRTAEVDAANAQFHEVMTGLEVVKSELSQTQSALAQRSAEADEVTLQLQGKREILSQLQDELTQVRSDLESERRRAGAELDKLRTEKNAAEGRLTARFSEIATLTRLLDEKEKEVMRSDHQVDWLTEVSAVLVNGSGSRSLKGRLAALLPAMIRLNLQKAKLKRQGLFDEKAYLSANPDVAEAAVDPLSHYISHGVREGRKLNPVAKGK